MILTLCFHLPLRNHTKYVFLYRLQMNYAADTNFGCLTSNSSSPLRAFNLSLRPVPVCLYSSFTRIHRLPCVHVDPFQTVASKY